jgi:hypothetical protein
MYKYEFSYWYQTHIWKETYLADQELNDVGLQLQWDAIKARLPLVSFVRVDVTKSAFCQKVRWIPK